MLGDRQTPRRLDAEVVCDGRVQLVLLVVVWADSLGGLAGFVGFFPDVAPRQALPVRVASFGLLRWAWFARALVYARRGRPF